MLYLGNGEYELLNGKKISVYDLKEILEEFYYDNKEEFYSLITDFNLYKKGDLKKSFEEGKEYGYEEAEYEIKKKFLNLL